MEQKSIPAKTNCLVKKTLNTVWYFLPFQPCLKNRGNQTITNIGVRVAERSKACVSHARGHRFESCRGNYFKKKNFFFNNWRQNSLSLTEALACLVIALQRGMIERKQHSRLENQFRKLISSIVCQKTSSENRCFRYSMLENQFRKHMETNQKISTTVNSKNIQYCKQGI